MEKSKKNRNNKFISIKGDPKRQAPDLLRAIEYQVWNTVYDWLSLDDEQCIYIEGAEDYDVIGKETSTMVQVRHVQSKISLGSKKVLETIVNYWNTLRKNPGRSLSFRYLTISKLSKEQGNPFGKGQFGILLWNECESESSNVAKIKNFLFKHIKQPQTLLDFLAKSSNEEFFNNIIEPITWEVDAGNNEYIINAIERKLILHGDKKGVSASDAIKVKNRLYTEALNIAGKKKLENRFLERVQFLIIFDEETTVNIPIQQYQAFFQPASYNGLELSNRGNGSLPYRFTELAKPYINSQNFLVRSDLVTSLHSSLMKTRLLLIKGSSGMGKSTLAFLISERFNNKLLWFDFRNIRDKDIITRILQIDIELDRSLNDTIGVILDDLDLSTESINNYATYLGGLIFAVLHKKMVIIITSTKDFPGSFSQTLNKDFVAVTEAPRFSEIDISDFIKQLGNDNEKYNTVVAKSVSLHTSGHPQLVHARLMKLQEEEWPPLSAEELITLPVEVQKVKSQNKEYLLDTLNSSQLNLLYRLSLLIGLFRRDHAVALGSIDPSIEFPGINFDRLIGPYVEIYNDEYYRISPLLKGIANDDLPKNDTKLLHSSIAKSYESCGNVTQIEIQALLFHSFIGENDDVFIHSIISLLNSQDNELKIISIELSWVLSIGLKGGENAYPHDPRISLFLRYLQFRIARLNKDDSIQQIITVWDRESTISKVKSDNILPDLLSRLTFISNVLIHYEIHLGPKNLISYLLEAKAVFEDIFEQKDIETNEAVSLLLEQMNHQSTVHNNALSHLPFFITPRCKDINYLKTLISELRKISIDEQLAILQRYSTDSDSAHILIQQSWINEHKKEEPRWDECLSVFEESLEYFKNLELLNLIVSTYNGISVVLYDYLNRPEEALSKLNECKQLFGFDARNENQIANWFFQKKEYFEAIKIWDDLFSTWEYEKSDTSAMFALRNAGISAAFTGDYDKCNSYFGKAAEYAKNKKLRIYYIGFIADSAYICWKMGNKKESINLFSCAIEEIKNLDSLTSNLDEFGVYKFVTHIIGWLGQDHRKQYIDNYFEPFPGMCSNPDKNKKILDLPFVPLELSFSDLLTIEFDLNFGDELFNKYSGVLSRSKIPVQKMVIANLELKKSFRNIDFFNFFNVVFKFLDSINLVKEQQIKKMNIWDEYDHKTSSKIFAEDIIKILIHSLVALVRFNCVEISTVDNWINTEIAVDDKEKLLLWLKELKSCILLDDNTLKVTLKKAEQPFNDRVIAALLLLKDDSLSPDDLLYASAIVFIYFRESRLFTGFEIYVEELITSRWLEKIKNKALFKMPRLTVPEIEEQCCSEETGMKKVRKILIAASHGVDLKLPSDI